MLSSRKTAFTPLGLIFVFALVCVLATIMFMAMDPAKTFAEKRNTQRQEDTRNMLNAINRYLDDQGHTINDFGTIAACPGKTYMGKDKTSLDLSSKLVSSYLMTIPFDPATGDENNTGYTICQTNGRPEVDAPNAENNKSISIHQ